MAIFRSPVLILPALLWTVAIVHPPVQAAELIWPQQRQAYYADEPITLAIAGTARGVMLSLDLVPLDAGATPVRLPLRGNGSTVTFTLPPTALAPGTYAVKLEGKPVVKLRIASGVIDSSLLLSQTLNLKQSQAAGANFMVGNAFNFGRFNSERTGPLTVKLRASRSPGLATFERAIAANLPTLVYMYWTGYVTHKPFGSQKSWANGEMGAAMRLLSFHTAQRLRRFGKNIISIGSLDEPGLSWGKTPTGRATTGFPNWDEQPWYTRRGWQFTNNPAAGSGADWQKYMVIRRDIIRERQAEAKKDLQTVWPGLVFSTDLYAPHAIMDGTDPLNQEVNQVPATHVFLDYGLDRLGAYSSLMLEKAHAPSAKIAHAMNGQLFGEPVPQPQQLYAYRLALNGLLAAGLASNWWLNTTAMTPADLAAVNHPAKRIGPLLRETSPDHEVAVLWSETELMLRQQPITLQEASRSPGDMPLKLTVSPLADQPQVKGEINLDAYSVGHDYKQAVLTAHYALARAGYPADILHERLLPRGILRHYRTLVVVGQTHSFPPDVDKALQAFVSAGGKVVVDRSITLKLDRAITAQTNLAGLGYRWLALLGSKEGNPRQTSYFQTNHFMDEPVRQAVLPFKQAMAQTTSQPRLLSSSTELLVERHTAGTGFIYLVINGYEQLPQLSETQKYGLYNYAPYQVEYQLRGLPPQGVVYGLEGADWARGSQLSRPAAPITAKFAPAEMKIYLVAPRAPAGLSLSGRKTGGMLTVQAALQQLKMPWPLRVVVQDPSGKSIYQVDRATRPDGSYSEQFPLGENVLPGAYTVRITSPLGNLSAQTQINVQPALVKPQVLTETVQVFDRQAMSTFLAAKPALTIALGQESHRSLAEQLARRLSTRGFKVTIKPETEVLHKVAYPRVWNPYARIYQPKGEERSLQGQLIDRRIQLTTDNSGKITARTQDGQDLGGNWRQPNSFVTVGGEGYLDWSGDEEIVYEPGVKLYVDRNRRVRVIKGTPVEVPTTTDFKAKWAKPWTVLTSHQGAYQLPPQLPEAYQTDSHLILLGDSTTSQAVAVLQASDLLLQIVDEQYPGSGQALLSFVWSPFAVEKNVILIGATDEAGLQAGINRLLNFLPP
uniref:Uncharacterized protein n=1 Tax=Cyanothece sp. (strain PCC 7425 / ATCC 29141) TaxID=395961 RepID=B8HR30_CYAP4